MAPASPHYRLRQGVAARPPGPGRSPGRGPACARWRRSTGSPPGARAAIRRRPGGAAGLGWLGTDGTGVLTRAAAAPGRRSASGWNGCCRPTSSAKPSRPPRTRSTPLPDLAAACWQILRGLGFDRGRILEPGCGAGAFLAATPADIEATWMGVERDPVTARIAQTAAPGCPDHQRAAAERRAARAQRGCGHRQRAVRRDTGLRPDRAQGRHQEPAQLLHLAVGPHPAARRRGGPDHLPVHDGRPRRRGAVGDRRRSGPGRRDPAARRCAGPGGTEVVTDILVLRRRSSDAPAARRTGSSTSGSATPTRSRHGSTTTGSTSGSSPIRPWCWASCALTTRPSTGARSGSTGPSPSRRRRPLAQATTALDRQRQRRRD